MVKLIFCACRRPDMSYEEFLKYWHEQHSPLVKELSKTLGIKRYIQCRTIETHLNNQLRHERGTLKPFDGVAELWWDNIEELEALGSTSEGQEAIRRLIEDERKFIDFPLSSLFLTEEHMVFELQRNTADEP